MYVCEHVCFMRSVQKKDSVCAIFVISWSAVSVITECSVKMSVTLLNNN